MQEKKYELIKDQPVEFRGHKLYRIRALKDVRSGNLVEVHKGDLGGLIEKEANLSHDGKCWIEGTGMVFDNAKVSDSALIMGKAKIYGNAEIRGSAIVCDNAMVYDNAQIYGRSSVYGNAQVYEDAIVHGRASISENAQVFGDAEVCGKAKVNRKEKLDVYYNVG